MLCFAGTSEPLEPSHHSLAQSVQPQPVTSQPPLSLARSLLPSLPPVVSSVSHSLFLVFPWMFPSFPPHPENKCPPTPGSLSPPDFSPLPPVRPSKSSTSAPLAFIPFFSQFPSITSSTHPQPTRNTSPVSSRPVHNLQEAIQSLQFSTNTNKLSFSMTIDQSYPMTIITFKITAFTL